MYKESLMHHTVWVSKIAGDIKIMNVPKSPQINFKTSHFHLSFCTELKGHLSYNFSAIFIQFHLILPTFLPRSVGP